MSKKQNPIDEYIVHGVKTVIIDSLTTYDYYLLIDATGNCYISRVADDDSSYKFVKMPSLAETASYSEIAEAIDAFWVSPEDESKVYKYLFEC